MRLNVTAALEAIAATATMDGLSISGSNRKLGYLLGLRDHLIGALEELEKLKAEAAKGHPEVQLLEGFTEALEQKPYLRFELGYTRATDWMVHVRDGTGGRDVRLAEEQEVTYLGACRHALITLRARGVINV